MISAFDQVSKLEFDIQFKNSKSIDECVSGNFFEYIIKQITKLTCFTAIENFGTINVTSAGLPETDIGTPNSNSDSLMSVSFIWKYKCVKYMSILEK